MKNIEQNLQKVLDCLREFRNNDLLPSCKYKLRVKNSKKNSTNLDNLGISYEETNSQTVLQIDLDQDNFYIRKSAEHFLQTCRNQIDDLASYFRKDVMILDKNIIYIKGEPIENNPLFFRNTLCSFSLLELLRSNVVDFDDVVNQKLILLSQKTGKIELSYKDQFIVRALILLEGDNDFIEVTKKLKNKIEADAAFIGFFKDAFIENATVSFFESLEKIDRVHAIAERNFQLYKNKFDFKKFEKGLHEAKESYFNTYFNFQSEMLSKINALPIQFGIYIFLLYRFSENILGVATIIILMLGWSFFSVATIVNLEKDLESLKEDFLNSLKRIKARSGFNDADLKEYKCLVLDKSKNSIKRVKQFKYIVILFTCSFLIFAFREIFSLAQ